MGRYHSHSRTNAHLRARLGLLGLLLFSLSGCAYSTHLYHVSDNDPENAGRSYRLISAETERQVILWLNFDVDYAREAYEALLARCPDGPIDNVHTRYSTALQFMSYTQKIQISARCYAR